MGRESGVRGRERGERLYLTFNFLELLNWSQEYFFSVDYSNNNKL